MIVEAIMNLMHGLASAVFTWASSALPDPPSFVADVNEGVSTLFASIPGPVRWFVPIAPAVAVGFALLGIYLVAGGVRVGRRALSLFTGGGGNA